MCRARDPKSWRELRDELRALGARNVRTQGSHESWRFVDGELFVVIRCHLSDSVPLGILVKFRRLRRRREACVGNEPVPLGERTMEVRPIRDRQGKEAIMAKGNSGGGPKGGGSKGGGGPKGGGAPKGGHGGNWPSTTGNPSGGGRGNAAPSK